MRGAHRPGLPYRPPHAGQRVRHLVAALASGEPDGESAGLAWNRRRPLYRACAEPTSMRRAGVEDISRLRNIAVVGTHHSGKTTLVETILATCGAISRRGSVADGTTTTDFEPECIEHLQSTCVGFAYAMCGAVDLNLIDCPGFIDFFEETKIALLAADAALIVIEPDPGRIGQTQSLVDFIEAHKLPHLFLVNKMDRPGADFLGTLAALQQAYGMHVVAQQIPIGAGETYRGFVDLAENKAYLCNECEQDETEIPADLQPIVSEQRTKLLEALGDFDDHLLEELLDGIEPSREEIRRDLCEDCSHDRIIPVLAASGLTGAGIRALLETIEREFPSPEAEPRHDSAGRLVARRRRRPAQRAFPPPGEAPRRRQERDRGEHRRAGTHGRRRHRRHADVAECERDDADDRTGRAAFRARDSSERKARRGEALADAGPDHRRGSVAARRPRRIHQRAAAPRQRRDPRQDRDRTALAQVSPGPRDGATDDPVSRDDHELDRDPCAL